MDWASLLASAPFARQAGYGGVTAATRLQNAKIIVEEFLSAGLPLGVALAAVVNADAESGLNHMAMGDNGKSVGLFQLHENGGGKGMSAADRQNPRLNTRRIISEYAAAKSRTSGVDLSQGKKVVPMESLDAAYARGATVGDLAGLFAFHVERPWDLVGEKEKRAARARSTFSAIASVPAVSLQRGVDTGAALVSSVRAVAPFAGAGLFVWSLVGLVVIGAGYWLFRKK